MADDAASGHQHDGDGSNGGQPQQEEAAGASSGGGDTFRQIPINTLMDHNDDIRRVCDDFSRALKVHAAEEERLSGGIYRALHSTSNGRAPPMSGGDAPAPAPPSAAPPSSAPPPSSASAPAAPSGGEMPSIDAALLTFRGFLSSLAQAHTRYARSLTDEIRRPLQALLEQQHQQHARIKVEWNRVVKLFYARREALGRAKEVVRKATQDHEAACALYESAAERRSVSMASFTADLHKVRQRCEKAQLQRAQAEKWEREVRGELYDAVGERDDFIRHAARAYQEMEGRRLRELKQAMLAAARAEKAHCLARLKEAEALERAAGAVDVDGDMARMVSSHRDPEATHAYARALVILDWGWRRHQQLAEARRRAAREQQQLERQQQLQLQQSSSSSSVRRSASAELELAGSNSGSSSTSNSGSGSGGMGSPRREDGGPPPPPPPSSSLSSSGEEKEEVMSGIDAVLERLLLLSPSPPDAAAAATSSSSPGAEREGAGAGAGAGQPFEELIESEKGRAYFLQQLNEQRGRRKGDVGAGYGGLARCFQLLLDKCQAAHDVRAAQQAMALANTFFRESNTKGSGGSGGEGEGERREYLLPLVKAHPIWQERRLWEDSLMLSVADQLELCPQTCPWEELRGEALREQVVRVHNLVFAQLASLALHMRECGVGVGEVKEFVRTMAGRTQLGEEQAAALEQEMARWGTEGGGD